MVGKTTVLATTSHAPSVARRIQFRSRPPPDAMSTARIAGAKQTPAPRWVAAADAAAVAASRGNLCKIKNPLISLGGFLIFVIVVLHFSNDGCVL